MEVKIVVKKWFIKEKEDKSKTIAGQFAVMCGPTQISESNFNDGYQSTNISIPSELMLEAETLDAKIRDQIVHNFTN